MRGLLIKSKSDAGNAALKQNQKETLGARFIERQQLKLTYKIRFDTEREFYELRIYGRSRYITPALTRPVMVDMMKENGAEEGRDYLIVEVDE